jgi:hypothetical protein
VTKPAHLTVENINPALFSGEVAPVESLKHFPGNARTHDLPKIAESLATNGQYKRITVRHDPENPENDGVVLAGNGTLEAARDSLGWKYIAVERIPVDDETALRINLVDNSTNDAAGYDEGALAALLQSLDGKYRGTGYEEADLTELLGSLFPDDPIAPLLQISPFLMERHDFVVLYFDNELDWVQAQQVLGVQTVKAWDAKPGYERKGVGRLIPGAPVVRRLDGTH